MKRIAIVLLIAIFTLSACQTQPQDASIDAQVSLGAAAQTFADDLHAAGATATTSIEVTQPFFSVGGIVLTVNGEDLQVFEYPDSASAQADADEISPDANTISGEQFAWIAPPHFYLSGNLLILYIGDDAGTVSLIEAVVGSQFAGY